jgi:hypothetical protein
MIWCGVRAVVLHQRRRQRFSRSGDPATGDFGDAIVLKKFGEVPDDLRSTASAFPTASSRALRWKAIGSLSVTLTAQPRDATVFSVYPVLCISFVFKPVISRTGTAGYSARIFQSSSACRTILKVTFIFAMRYHAWKSVQREPGCGGLRALK